MKHREEHWPTAPRLASSRWCRTCSEDLEGDNAVKPGEVVSHHAQTAERCRALRCHVVPSYRAKPEMEALLAVAAG
ncbi:MAG: hypothetical protein AVDCRST_MAG75-288 [uncultured Propionibacteriaceae bacterium]|uniref:Uncharacterized protein n=1 Tax=uncultured Propionibacteriaceae bacterium TaxID=257457 RepID=A0A6J4N2R4_9ACTN|nr:MAG: hypothetical protein AVDCRST_MAG75-288 [uncultured Propionibacteriaceae bacterium]